jgi:hypothetical protein
MADENEHPKRLHMVEEHDTVEGLSYAFDAQGRHLREGAKPSAPANLVLPKPVAIPAATAQNNSSNSQKK